MNNPNEDRIIAAVAWAIIGVVLGTFVFIGTCLVGLPVARWLVGVLPPIAIIVLIAISWVVLVWRIACIVRKKGGGSR